MRELGEVVINGQKAIQLQCYFGSHSYNSKEFSVLLNGVLDEAKELGIETLSEADKDLLLKNGVQNEKTQGNYEVCKMAGETSGMESGDVNGRLGEVIHRHF